MIYLPKCSSKAFTYSMPYSSDTTNVKPQDGAPFKARDVPAGVMVGFVGVRDELLALKKVAHEADCAG